MVINKKIPLVLALGPLLDIECLEVHESRQETNSSRWTGNFLHEIFWGIAGDWETRGEYLSPCYERQETNSSRWIGNFLHEIFGGIVGDEKHMGRWENIYLLAMRI